MNIATLAVAAIAAAVVLHGDCAAAEDAPMPCPGALAWQAQHPDESDQAMAQRDAARTLSNPDLRAALAHRFERDQQARLAYLAAPGSDNMRRRLRQVDEDNLAWLSRQVQAHGFPTAAQVGEHGVEQAWLLAQHADRDPAFQASLLAELTKRHADGELRAVDLSRFVDRVLVAARQPQRYATQFTPEQWSGAFFGLPDEASLRVVEEHRKNLGVMPLADYVCMMSFARRR